MNLSKQERVLLDYMLRHANIDVPISDIMENVNVSKAANGRTAQQYIGSITSRINRKQSAYEIVPGLKLKRTYRLQAKSLLL